MSKYLPIGDFKWLTEKEINKINLHSYKDDSNKGIILEVDLEYPDELHDLHNDFPLCPEKMKINPKILSNYCSKLRKKYSISSRQVQKLTTNLYNKNNYVLHYKNLQLYLDLGMKLKKVHRVLEFTQAPFLKEYIDFNTKKRAAAKNNFEINFFKLMNNVIYGKTMENLRKRVNIILVTSKQKLEKLASKPTFKNCKIFNENLVAVSKIKETLYLNRPSYVGFCILEISKTLMYDFHYNFIKNKYGEKAKLLFTDTDSLCYEIETKDIYKDLWKDKDLFDNSAYPIDSPFFDKSNEKVIGKMKDEAAGQIISEFVGLRSKMYSYIKNNLKEARTAKGIKKNIIKKQLTHETYKDVLFNEKQLRHSMNTIRSKNHEIGSYEINKISLSAFDDKRYILEDGITSYAYGHHLIKQ